MSNNLPPELRSVLPADTATSWVILRDHLPPTVTLFGGTAIAAHLHHRVSRDLDFFYTDPNTNVQHLREKLESLRPTAVTLQDQTSLNAVFGHTKVQFLHAAEQRDLEPPTLIAGIKTAGLRDLTATKLKVILDRGELRDYYDLMAIEQHTGIKIETALSDYQHRYNDPNSNNIYGIIRGLGSFSDVIDDPGLPTTRETIERYWESRQRHILTNLDSTGTQSSPQNLWATRSTNNPNPETNNNPPSSGDERIWVEPHSRNGRHINGYWRRR